MSTTSINYLNVGLMLVACAIAFALPFELFLFSYAVLGPLHYLTEINWLHKRNYFTNAKRDYYLLVFLCVLVFIVVHIISEYNMSSTSMIFLAFFSSLAMVLFKKAIPKLIFLAFVVAAIFIFSKSRVYVIFFAVFLPTIVHVFLFTGAFILYGALKSRSVSGVLSLVVFILCGISFFLISPEFSWYNMSDYVRNTFIQSGFDAVNIALMNLFNFGIQAKAELFYSENGLAVMRFIAFAYTYHYLNWFSKTSIIGWHKVSRRNLAILIIVWLVSIGLYAYNYKTGLIYLYFLSMLHVFLEFPLNYRSFIGIGEETLSLVGLKPAVAATGKGAGPVKKSKKNG